MYTTGIIKPLGNYATHHAALGKGGIIQFDDSLFPTEEGDIAVPYFGTLNAITSYETISALLNAFVPISRREIGTIVLFPKDITYNTDKVILANSQLIYVGNDTWNYYNNYNVIRFNSGSQALINFGRSITLKTTSDTGDGWYTTNPTDPTDLYYKKNNINYAITSNITDVINCLTSTTNLSATTYAFKPNKTNIIIFGNKTDAGVDSESNIFNSTGFIAPLYILPSGIINTRLQFINYLKSPILIGPISVLDKTTYMAPLYQEDCMILSPKCSVVIEYTSSEYMVIHDIVPIAPPDNDYYIFSKVTKYFGNFPISYMDWVIQPNLNNVSFSGYGGAKVVSLYIANGNTYTKSTIQVLVNYNNVTVIPDSVSYSLDSGDYITPDSVSYSLAAGSLSFTAGVKFNSILHLKLNYLGVDYIVDTYINDICYFNDDIKYFLADGSSEICTLVSNTEMTIKTPYEKVQVTNDGYTVDIISGGSDSINSVTFYVYNMKYKQTIDMNNIRIRKLI
jgi:hypothetical protein